MRHAALPLLLALVCSIPTAQGADTWAARLGYPPETRVLILYAHHGGAAYEFNRPSQELLGKGLVQSAGVMMPGAWSDQFGKWCRENPGHDVGVCLTLSSPNEIFRLRPVCSYSTVPSLVDTDGFFSQSLHQVALRARPEEVRREVDRQIERARIAGIRPTHLIPCHGTLLTRPDLLQLYLRTAVEHWIPAVMIELTPGQIERLEDEGFPLSQEMIDCIGRYPLPKLDDLRSVPDAESYEGKRKAFRELVEGLEPGITQITLHPADETAALKLVSPRWRNQVWAAQLLEDADVRKFLENEKVVFTCWAEIMRRFEHGVSDEW